MKQVLKQWMEKSGKLLMKFKYPALLLIVGLFLAFFPFHKQTEQKQKSAVQQEYNAVETTPASELDYLERVQEQLTDILSQIEGAGRVRVMLTLKTGEEVHYQTDSERTQQENDGYLSQTIRDTTVILSRSGTYDEAAVVKTEYPVFQGALIVSEGADNAKVCLALKSAVSALLCVGTDKITVVKMK